jgi:prepilin-type N-terminal cleavage/methylation domain-containing protein
MQPKANSGFTLAEILIAAAIGAGLIAAAVIGFATISQVPSRAGRVDVYLPASALQNFYGPDFDDTYVTLAISPNYAQGVEARRIKDLFARDVSSATAVFCLGRNQQVAKNNRTDQLGFTNQFDFRTNATPQAFRDFLTTCTNDLSASAIFPAGQPDVLTNTTNLSIFLLGGLSTVSARGTNALNLLATYEVDFVPATTPSGTYATVRRYSGTNAAPTDYYHAFYPDQTNGAGGFRPLAAFFPRMTNGAANHPFYLVWWPDPLVSALTNAASPGTGVPGGYTNMAGRTSLFFAVPAFPGL